MEKLFYSVFLCLITTLAFGQKSKHQLSTHILDISKGSPAKDISIKLEKYDEQTKAWSFVDEKKTDLNGRIGDFLSSEKSSWNL